MVAFIDNPWRGGAAEGLRRVSDVPRGMLPTCPEPTGVPANYHGGYLDLLSLVGLPLRV
jgi:hypothetical protein